MRRLFAFFFFLVFPAKAETVVYVSEGGHNCVAVYSLDEEAAALSRKGEVRLSGAPGALAVSRDGKRIYAAVRSEKRFATFAVDPATGLLSILATAAAAGNPAYIHPDATGRWLLAAYYGEGLVSVSPINQAGIVVEDPIQVLDIGPKAHCIHTDPANRFVFTPHPMDLNCVDQFRFDAVRGELSLNDPPTMTGEAKAGPRHLKFHPNGKWAYIVNEQGKSITFCHYDPEKGRLTKQQPSRPIPGIGMPTPEAAPRSRSVRMGDSFTRRTADMRALPRSRSIPRAENSHYLSVSRRKRSRGLST